MGDCSLLERMFANAVPGLFGTIVMFLVLSIGLLCVDWRMGLCISLPVRFLYKGIIIKHNKTEPTYTKTSLFLCETRRFFMARTEKGVVATI